MHLNEGRNEKSLIMKNVDAYKIFVDTESSRLKF